MLIISCHADTGFEHHSLLDRGERYEGHLDNFVGVYAVMQAYFSGRITKEHTRIELTYGEETDMEGAREVAETLDEQDVVIVVDVTGTPAEAPLVVEKCRRAQLRHFLADTLDGIGCDIYEDCPDPISCFDETDVYVQVTPWCCFLGIPCEGGDYNEGHVTCRKASVAALAEAICRISERFPAFCKANGLRLT